MAEKSVFGPIIFILFLCDVDWVKHSSTTSQRTQETEKGRELFFLIVSVQYEMKVKARIMSVTEIRNYCVNTQWIIYIYFEWDIWPSFFLLFSGVVRAINCPFTCLSLLKQSTYLSSIVLLCLSRIFHFRNLYIFFSLLIGSHVESHTLSMWWQHI